MPADPLSWDDLRFFLRAAQAGTLAGAARALEVEHTTVGRRLSALERALGAPLVVRGRDGLTLTPLGEQLVPLAEDVERAVLALQARVATQRARVRLAVPSGMTPFFTADLRRLRERYPQLSLELVSGARPVDLARGEADLALRMGPVSDGDLVVRRLGESGFSLYAAEAYLARHPAPVRLDDDLRGHEVVGYDASLAGAPAARWLDAHAGGATVVLRSREMTDMLAAARSGMGLAVLPCLLGDADPALRRLTPEVVVRQQVSLVYRREARLSEEARAVMRFVAEVVRANADRLAGRS